MNSINIAIALPANNIKPSTMQEILPDGAANYRRKSTALNKHARNVYFISNVVTLNAGKTNFGLQLPLGI